MIFQVAYKPSIKYVTLLNFLIIVCPHSNLCAILPLSHNDLWMIPNVKPPAMRHLQIELYLYSNQMEEIRTLVYCCVNNFSLQPLTKLFLTYLFINTSPSSKKFTAVPIL